MRKFNCVFALLISICMLFCSCSTSSQAVSETEKNNTTSGIQTTEATVYTEEISTNTDNTQISTTAKSTSKAKQKTTTKTTHKAKETNNKTSKEANTTATTSTTTHHSEIISTTEKKQEATVNTAVTATTTTSYSEITCDIKIECTAILDSMDNLKAGHSSFVPSDGIILNTYTVTLPSGSTAYDALEKACSDKGIKLNAQKTAYGIYVAGINNLDEKDCGKNSGWIYSVNDKFPPKSCGSYKLSNGDKVVFSYTC